MGPGHDSVPDGVEPRCVDPAYNGVPEGDPGTRPFLFLPNAFMARPFLLLRNGFMAVISIHNFNAGIFFITRHWHLGFLTAAFALAFEQVPMVFGMILLTKSWFGFEPWADYLHMLFHDNIVNHNSQLPARKTQTF